MTALAALKAHLNIIGTADDELLTDKLAASIAFTSHHVGRLLPVIFEAPAGADWQDEELWHLVNPGLSCSPAYPDLAGLRQLAREAASRPADAESFRQFNLNIWAAHSRAPLLDMVIYDALAGEIDLADLAELPCYIGVDLALTGDLTAIVAAWRHDDGSITVMPWFFLPDDGLDERALQDGAPYVEWQRQGHLTTTPGAVTDLAAVEDFIRELCAANDVREIAFDPHLARTMMQRLYDDGLPTVEFRQAPLTMSPAIAELERAVLGGTLRHNGHPILRQHLDNVAVKVGETELKRLLKTTRRDRIDGAVAAVMAVGRAAANDNRKGWWESDAASELAA